MKGQCAGRRNSFPLVTLLPANLNMCVAGSSEPKQNTGFQGHSDASELGDTRCCFRAGAERWLHSALSVEDPSSVFLGYCCVRSTMWFPLSYVRKRHSILGVFYLRSTRVEVTKGKIKALFSDVQRNACETVVCEKCSFDREKSYESSHGCVMESTLS